MTPDKRLKMEPYERVAFVGKTQTGKTHAAGILALGIERLLVIDGKGKLSNSSRKAAGKYTWNLAEWNDRSGHDARQKLERGEGGRIRIPAPLSGNYEPYFYYAYRLENVTVYIDEMFSIQEGTRPGRWLNACYTRGAEMGIGIWAAAQRPRNVPAIMFSEAEWKLQFWLPRKSDREFMADEIGEEALQPLENREFWLYNQGWDSPVFYPYITSRPRRK